VRKVLYKNQRGQSILEYTLLLGVIVAGILIMQNFVKRGFQGNLKESADKMGEQFSASGTTIEQTRTMTADQEITDEVGTTSSTATGIGAYVSGVTGTVGKGVYSYSNRTGGDTTMENKTATESATQEKYKWSDHASETQTNFTAPF
jgi:uncharacterized protein (UPF0333 family)